MEATTQGSKNKLATHRDLCVASVLLAEPKYWSERVEKQPKLKVLLISLAREDKWTARTGFSVLYFQTADLKSPELRGLISDQSTDGEQMQTQSHNEVLLSPHVDLHPPPPRLLPPESDCLSAHPEGL